MQRMVRSVLFVGLVLGLLVSPTLGWAQTQTPEVTDLEDLWEHLPDFDTRQGVIQPTTAQVTAVENLGAQVVWGRFGTPHSLIKFDGDLATGLGGEAATAAREWIRSNRSLFRLSDQAVTNMELVSDVVLDEKVRNIVPAHVVLFRQRFGNYAAAQDGMITVGIIDGSIVYVSSTAAGNTATLQPATPTISAQRAWLAAATNVGRSATLADISNVVTQGAWTVFKVAGYAQPQRARLGALPLLNGQVRLVWETNVLQSQGGEAVAYSSFVDAGTGRVLLRQNRVYHAAHEDGNTGDLNTTAGQQVPPPPQTETFSGSFQRDPFVCGQSQPFIFGAGFQGIAVQASATVPTNDIVLKLLKGSTVVASADTGTSPEAITFMPPNGVEAGTYFVQVCPFEEDTDPTGEGVVVPAIPPFTYEGSITAYGTPADAPANPIADNPKWKWFPANPSLDYADTDTRRLGCWFSSRIVPGQPRQPIPGCQYTFANAAARIPWDTTLRGAADGEPKATNTTFGNQAYTSEAWTSPLTPAENYRPASANREYSFPWTNAWFNNKCNPALIASPTSNRNDIDAAVVNLFVQHNRMHDFSYRLGFTERAYNAQESNFGNTADPTQGKGNDPEAGNAQAGALSGGAPSYLGRDNANQIALQDGVPGITNMYLWQPIAAAFYPPCVDGDYDMSVIGHEYTHLISNRMVGGPDSGLTGHQAGSMGESWSDLVAAEYLNEYGFVPTNGENPFTVGAYVTGNKATGIRNYNMSANPLNYSNIGYDVVGPEVHSDGEVWDGVNFEIRQTLIDKYNALDPEFNASSRLLQKYCADGREPYAHCPGNRRWIQIMFSAFLLMPPDVSMVGARNAYLAAEEMLYRSYLPYYNAPSNKVELWKAFAKRGLGQFAMTAGTEDTDPTPSFESPVQSNEATIIFKPVADTASGAAIPNAEIYIGKYEARSTPIADTKTGGNLDDSAKFVPGTYDVLVQAPGYGHRRFTLNVTTSRIVKLVMPSNWASSTRGGAVTGSNANGAADGTDLNTGFLIDDREGTSFARTGRTPSVAGAEVIVDLGGGSHLVSRVQVSAFVRSFEDQQDPGTDTASQSRFSALRQFQILTCNANCDVLTNFVPVYTSGGSAFPSMQPRPTAPTLNIRSFNVTDTQATHVMLRVLQNQCTGTAAYKVEDNDPANTSHCVNGSTRDNDVRAAELQVFSQ